MCSRTSKAKIEIPQHIERCEESFEESDFPREEEFYEYACRIGINLQTESHLLPIAKEGLIEPLPEGWRPYLEKPTGKYFYFNEITGESQWENPLDDIYKDIVIRSRSDSIADIEDSSLAKDISHVSSLPEDMLPKKLVPLKRQGSVERLDPLILPNNERKAPYGFQPQSFSKGDSAGITSIPLKSLTLSGGGASFLKKTIQPVQPDSGSDSWTDSNNAEEAAKKISVVSKPNTTPTRGILRDGTDNPTEKKSIKFNTTIDQLNYQQPSESDWDSEEPEKNASDETNQSKNSDDTDASITSKYKVFDPESLGPIIGGTGDGLSVVSTVSSKTVSEEDEVTSDKRMKELKEKMNKERESEMERLKKENAIAIETLKKELENKLEEERCKLEKRYDDDLAALKESTEAMEMLEIEKMKLEYNRHLEEEKQRAQVEHERSMIKMFAQLEELQRKEKNHVQQQIDIEKSKMEMSKEMQAELKKKKEELKASHQKQLEQMKDYLKDSIARLKKKEEAEEEEMRKVFAKRKEEVKKEQKKLEVEVKEEKKKWGEQMKEEIKKREVELKEEKRKWEEQEMKKWEDERRKWEDELVRKWEEEKEMRMKEMEEERKKWEDEQKENQQQIKKEMEEDIKEDLKKSGFKVTGKATKEYLAETSGELKVLMEDIHKKRERLAQEMKSLMKQEEEMKRQHEEKKKEWEGEARRLDEKASRRKIDSNTTLKSKKKSKHVVTTSTPSTSPSQEVKPGHVSHEIKAVLSHEEQRGRNNRSPVASPDDCKVLFVNQKPESTPSRVIQDKMTSNRGKHTDIKYPKHVKKNANRRSKSYTSLNRNDSLSEDLRHILHSKHRLKRNLQVLDSTELSETMPTDSSGFSSTDCTLDWLDTSMRPVRLTQSTPTTTRILSSLKQLNDQVQSLHRVVTSGSQMNVCHQRSCCSTHRTASWDSLHPTYSYPMFKPTSNSFIERAQELKQWLVPGVTSQNNL